MRTLNATPVTAVFDIGKTNKKFLLFDENFEIVHQKYSKLEEAGKVDDDGYTCEDLSDLADWIKQQLQTTIQNKNFNIQALNFSAYGASLVHLDDNGNIITPFYSYLKPYPQELLHQFYENYGGKEQFALETASPPMGMLNSGLQLYWLKYAKPSLYENICHTLHFPSYLSAIFTGKYKTEYTSIGCHTAMWNYEENCYHRWLKEEGMLQLLHEIQPITHTEEVDFEDKKIKTGVGMHDSSAALLPYLRTVDEPFMLLSTGTWSVALNPFNENPLTFDELKRDCLCFMNEDGAQVKAARFFLGNEYAHQKEKLDSYFNHDTNHTEVPLNISLLKKIIESDNTVKRLQLETAHTSGPYRSEKPGEWKPSLFSSYEEGYHQLMIDLVAIQAESIKLAEGSKPIKKLIVTGGFSRNKFFLKMLASRFPRKEIYTSSYSHVSALGAAVAVSDNETERKLKELLDLKRYMPLRDCSTELLQYRWKNDC